MRTTEPIEQEKVAVLKLCKDCKWLVHPPEKMFLDSDLACQHPRNSFQDPVIGGYKRWSPSWLRSAPHPDICGIDAAWFEPKP